MVEFDERNVGAFQVDGGHVRPFQVCAQENGTAKIGAGNNRVLERCVREIGTFKMRILGASVPQIRGTQVRPGKMSKRHHCILEAREGKIGSIQLRMCQVGTIQ